jgi:hypothetical protein
MRNKSGLQIILAITQSAKELKRVGFPSASNGSRGIVATLETRQLIDWPKKQLAQTRNIPLGIFYREKRNTSVKGSKRNGNRNGKYRRKAATFVE